MSSDSVMSSDEDWSMLVVTCRRDEAEIVSDTMWQRGVVAVEERLSPLPDAVELWTSVGEDPVDVVDSLEKLECVVAVRFESVSRSVSDTWRAFAEPVRVDSLVRIVPAWLGIDALSGDVLIDPFDTFGLGNHPTTLGAMRLLLESVPTGSRVLDVGTGSGVLAIAVAKLRECVPTAFDISPSSRQVVAHNARLNSVEVRVVDGFHEIDEKFDVVVANILSPVLREMAHEIARVVSPDGFVVLSGMRSEQVTSVVECYDDMEIASTNEIDGWTSVLLRHR